MARHISKTELERLGKCYAERLLYNAKLRPEDLPELTTHPGWVDSGATVRKELVKDVSGVARRHLVDAGYNRETVIRVIGF